MRNYVVILIQLMIWSGYTLIEWLSKYDQIMYNVLMFFVFVYLAVLAGNFFLKSTRRTLLLTVFSLSIYGSIHVILNYV